MKEAYVIHCEDDKQVQSAELLATTLKFYDSSRPIVVVTPCTPTSFKVIKEVRAYESTSNPTLNYFKAIVDLDYDRILYFKPDQLMTHFTIDAWETLRNLSSVVTLEDRLDFAGEKILPDVYYQDSINIKTIQKTTNVNVVYFDFSKSARQLIGFCIDFSSDYSYESAQLFVRAAKDAGTAVDLPQFPEYIWPSWLLSFASIVFDEEFIKFNFVDNIDLSRQEFNIKDSIWASKRWNHFLSHWFTERGQLKIENFIQSGLIKYENIAWITDSHYDRIQLAYAK
jgi:hypothetical protein